MNLKHPLAFFSAGVILILFLFLIGIPIEIISSGSQKQPEKNNEPSSDVSLKDDDIKTSANTVQDAFINHMQDEKPKPIEEMNCTELNEFIISFEKGWGSAIPLYNEKCS